MMTLLLALNLGIRCASAAETFRGYSFYAGDPHAHTGVSGDGEAADMAGCVDCGTIADVFDYAAVRGLDFVAYSDHSNDDGNTRNADPDVYAAFLARQLAHDDDATGLIIIPSAEVWFTIGGVEVGHRNLLLFGDDATLAPFTLADATPNGDNSTEVGTCSAISDWMVQLTATYGDALLIPHHPYGLRPTVVDWSCHSDTWEPGVEVYSHWGSSLGWDRDYDSVSDPQSGHSVHDAMDPTGYGLHLGFLGGTDSHDTRPGDTCSTDTLSRFAGGLTMVALDSTETFSRGTIHDAIVAHSTYATTGPIVPMTVTYTLNGVEVAHLGQDVDVPAGSLVAVSVAVPLDDSLNVDEVLLVTPDGEIPLDPIGNGQYEGAIDPADLPAWAYAAVSLQGAPYKELPSCADGGDEMEWLWGSPTWFTTTDADADGDGYALSAGDCDDADPRINPAAREVWYDGVDENCDGLDDFDADGDGYRPLIHGGSDCDDRDATVRRPRPGHRVPPDCR